MTNADLLNRMGGGRTDAVFEFLRLPEWREALLEGGVKRLQWLVFYNDVTALKAVLEAGGDLSSIDLDEELGNASFFGRRKVRDFPIQHGAGWGNGVEWKFVGEYLPEGLERE